MNNKIKLVFFAIVAVGIAVGLKYNIFPKLGGGSLYEKPSDSISTFTGDRHDDGVSTTYYSNGKVHTETTYKNGERNGLMRTYYTNGALKSEAEYIDGKQNGLDKQYSKSGKLEQILTYEDGVLNGEAQAFDENEVLMNKAQFKNGVQVGRDGRDRDAGRTA